jgi:bla regulator protein BlaR1
LKRAPDNNPTKDQMRLMMQALLSERFKLSVHFETQIVPVFALVPAKTGKLGPQLRRHAEGPPCESGQPGGPARTSEVFPPVCDAVWMELQPNRLRKAGSRNTTMELLAGIIPTLGAVDRPVVDQTELAGRFDFAIEWAPDSTSAALPDTNAQTDIAGPTFLQALNEQLGLKLESTRWPVRELVVDHLERPSDN